MFTVLFPIFCFGLVISGIVALGVLEGARELKAAMDEHEGPELESEKRLTSAKAATSAPQQLEQSQLHV